MKSLEGIGVDLTTSIAGTAVGVSVTICGVGIVIGVD
jgi:hypothetical protein